MSPLEIKDEELQRIGEFKALKSLFGEMLLKDNGVLNEGKNKINPMFQSNINYLTRKFKESQNHLNTKR